MKKFTSKKQKIGEIGEKNAEIFLVKRGFSIIERNYSNKFGEIDLIAIKNNRYHFIEVKTISVSHETNDQETESVRKKIIVTHETGKNHIKKDKRTVSRETFIKEYRKIYNPFQNISQSKIKKIIKTSEIYLGYHKIDLRNSWQIDGIGVFLDSNQETYRCEYIEHINI